MEKIEQLYIILVSELEKYADCVYVYPEESEAIYNGLRIKYKSGDISVQVTRNDYTKICKVIEQRKELKKYYVC